MAHKSVTFTGFNGAQLSARLDLPDGPRKATALMAHCFTCSKDLLGERRIASRLAASGVAVLRFDFTGLGKSGGTFSETSFSSNVQDLICAADWLAKQGTPPDLLIGHSLGGAAILKAARQIESAKAVVTIGAPFDPHHVTQNFQNHLDRIEADGEATVLLSDRPFTITREFVQDISAAELGPSIASLKKALLILHAPLDDQVGIDNAAEIFKGAKHPKSFITLDGADHLLNRAEDAEYAAEVIAAWSARYLDLQRSAAPIGAPEGVVRVSEADPEGFKQDVLAGPRHHTLADEPITYGGTDSGFTPYQFLSAGLGACTSMTIRMYARRKNWPLKHVFVDVTHDKIHATDSGNSNSASAKIDTFTRRITLEGALTGDQRQRLLEIADKCPVHNTLKGQIRVETTLTPE